MIKYPRNTEAVYCLFDTATGQPVEGRERVRYNRADGLPVEDPENRDHVYLEVIQTPAPEYDPTTQARQADWVADVENGTYTLTHTIEDLDLPTAIERTHQRLKQERESLLESGFEFGGKSFQTRNASDRINITGVGLAAQAALGSGSPFSVDFRAQDNTVVTMDAMTALQFYLTMVGAAQAIWGAFNTADASVDTAPDIATLKAITLL